MSSKTQDPEVKQSKAEPERQISHEKFGQLDENGDGFISKNEFRKSLKKQGLFEREDAVDAAWSHFDKNTDGRISFGGKILCVIIFSNPDFFVFCRIQERHRQSE